MIPMASTFSRAMERHSGPHGGAILRFLTKFHENPRHPSHSLERVVNARSDDVWSARVNSDLRVILSHWGEHWIALAFTVFISLTAVVTLGSTAGAMLPFLLQSCRLDPATSSAPFVATIVDVAGLVIYFTVAMSLFSGLGQ
jgi:hypothetical protein